MTRPTGTSQPLQMARWSNLFVMGHGVTSRAMQKMGPIINVLGTGLNSRLPFPSLVYMSYSLGSENPHHFTHGNFTQIFCHHQVHHAINIGQFVACQSINRDRAVYSCGLHLGTSLSNILGIGIEPMHLITIIRPQREGALPIFTSQMHNETTFNV